MLDSGREGDARTMRRTTDKPVRNVKADRPYKVDGGQPTDAVSQRASPAGPAATTS